MTDALDAILQATAAHVRGQATDDHMCLLAAVILAQTGISPKWVSHAALGILSMAATDAAVSDAMNAYADRTRDKT